MKSLKIRIVLILIMGINIVYSQDTFKCQDFRVGKFDVYHDEKINSRIIRKSRFQKEIDPTGGMVKMKISWIDDCTYRLTFVRANKKYYEKISKVDAKSQKELIVKIRDINGSEYYSESNFVGLESRVFRAKVVKIK